MLSKIIMHFHNGNTKSIASAIPIIAHVPILHGTVNSEIFARIFISQGALKDVFVTLKNLQLGHDLPTFKRQSDFPIWRKFYFHKTSHLRSFTKIKSSRTILNLQVYMECQSEQQARLLWRHYSVSSDSITSYHW